MYQWLGAVRNAQQQQSLWRKRSERNPACMNEYRKACTALGDAYAEAAKHCGNGVWRTRYQNLAQTWRDLARVV